MPHLMYLYLQYVPDALHIEQKHGFMHDKYNYAGYSAFDK